MKRLVICLLLIGSLGFSAVQNRALIAHGRIITLTEENFKEICQSKKPIIIDINASWCSACKSLAPIFDDMSEKYREKIIFAKIDADAQSALSDKYQVTALPTVLFFKAGQKNPSMRHVGSMSSEDFDRIISEFLKNQ